MSIGVVGFGHVGKVMKALFPEALVYDKYTPEAGVERQQVAECEVTFVCVPTNEGPEGHADLTAVEEVVSWLRSEIIVLRSTVPPGTSRRLCKETGRSVVMWPEFYGEWKYPSPWEYTPQGWPSVILGGEPEATRSVIELIAPRLGPMKSYRQTSFEAAELCKYMENTWLAAQVVFAWQFHMLAEGCDADYWEVRELWGLDPRITKAHTVTLSYDKGFGGKCLPKDLAAIIAHGKRLGVDVSFLASIQAFNERLKADEPERSTASNDGSTRSHLGSSQTARWQNASLFLARYLERIILRYVLLEKRMRPLTLLGLHSRE